MKGGPEPVLGSWVIQGLEEGEGYQARVQAKNRYGWSDHSETLYFFAEPHGENPSYTGSLLIRLCCSYQGCGAK